MKINRKVLNINNKQLLQILLDSIAHWKSMWQMQIATDKCTLGTTAEILPINLLMSYIKIQRYGCGPWLHII
jgi:hypothetical protein